jgi:hypothetical protein
MESQYSDENHVELVSSAVEKLLTPQLPWQSLILQFLLGARDWRSASIGIIIFSSR